MPEGLKTRQVDALRMLLERRDFTAEDVAALDYHLLARMPGVGGKSLDIIRGWLAAQGLDLLNSPADYSRSLRFCRLEARLVRARKLLERNGYSVTPPELRQVRNPPATTDSSSGPGAS